MAYKKLICGLAFLWKRPKLLGRLSVVIDALPPDKRIRDLDNLLKIVLDSLQFAGLFENDSQIDRIYISRGPTFKNGKLLVCIDELK